MNLSQELLVGLESRRVEELGRDGSRVCYFFGSRFWAKQRNRALWEDPKPGETGIREDHRDQSWPGVRDEDRKIPEVEVDQRTKPQNSNNRLDQTISY